MTQQVLPLELEVNKDSAHGIHEERRREWIYYGVILLAYVLVRLFVWQRTTLLEDHDSVSYLESIKIWLTFDFRQIRNLSPDTTPLYPFCGALFSLFGWSVETGARLCSLAFSVALFFFVIGIGQKFASPLAIGSCLLLLTFDPALVPLSISVLTEPVFIAIVYGGLWLFWKHIEQPTKRQGLLQGLVFGLSFLARTEGLIFLVAVPIFQIIHTRFFQRERPAVKTLLAWVVSYVVSFSVVSLPQVWKVSHQMGRFAINGRQAWELILNHPDGKSYEEKIYGLDYSPKQINLEYIQSHPEALAKLQASAKVSKFVETIKRNAKDLVGKQIGLSFKPLAYRKELGLLFGAPGLLVFLIGILSLVRARRFDVLFLSFAFIGTTLTPPLIHDVDTRHIAVIAPLILLVGGVGLAYLTEEIVRLKQEWLGKSLAPMAFSGGLLVLVFAMNGYPLLDALRPPKANFDYSPAALQEPLRIVKNDTSLNHGKVPRIAVRKGYFSYMAGAQRFFIPFTDYSGLVEYCRMNDIDYLFLQDILIPHYPFFRVFDHDPPEFERLYTGGDGSGGRIRLYRFRKSLSTLSKMRRGESFQ